MFGVLSRLVKLGSGYIFSTVITDIVFFTGVFYSLWVLIKPLYGRRKSALKLQEIAGSPQKHWFYGHLLQCTNYAAGFQWLIDKTLQFPEMMAFWYNPFLSVLFVHHPNSASAFVNSGAPKTEILYRMLKPLVGDGLLTSSGKKWIRNRKLLTPAFHYNILKQYTLTFNKSVKTLLNKWEDKVGKNIEISNDVSLMTLDTMLKCAMSSDLNPQGSKTHPYLEFLSRCQELALKRLITPLHHIDWIYNNSQNGKEFNKCVEILHNYTEKIIAERKVKLENSESTIIKGKNALDFLDMLLLTKDEDGNGLTDVEIRNEVDTFLFAGHDTTASGIQWALYNLAKYPVFQEKCRQEINEVVGDEENVEWSDISKLVYLTKFIKESMRLNPPVTIIGRMLDRSIHFQSSINEGNHVTIPKNSATTLCIYSLHNNSHVWEEPEIFDLERFNKENSSKRSPYAYLPFSAGSRNCIGQNFAMNEIKIVLAQTIRTFRLSIKDDTPESKIQRKLTLQSESGIHVYVEDAE